MDDYGNFEAVGNGVANVTIDLIGNGKYLSSTANVIVTVSSVETSITVDPSFDLYVGQNKNINAKLNPNAGSLIYKSNDTNVVSINENGFMRVLNEGVAEITVSYTGVGRYLSSNATVIVNVQKGPTRIDVEDEIVIYITDSAKYLNARLISEWENQPVNVGLEYLCNDTSVLKMNGKYMNARKVGEVELTIGFAGSNKYLPSSKKILVRVVLEPTEITAPSEIILLNGETDNLNATLNHAGQLNFLSDNPDVVTVDDGGNIAACGIGKANITITFNETDKYAPASKTVVIEVVGSKVQTTILANETINVYVGNSTNIEATINPISALLNGNLIYVVENPEIIEIDENGNIKGLKVGSTKITISYDENGRFLLSNKLVNVNVLINPSEIAAPENISLNLTESISIGAHLVKPIDGQLTYRSNDEQIITVDENGLITAHKLGNTTITIDYAGNENYTASSKTVEVNVVGVSTSIEVTDNIEVNLSETCMVNARLVPYVGKLSYESSNTSVVTVSDYGLITARGIGEADITVSFAGEGKYLPNSTVVHVKVTAVVTSIDIISNIEINRTERANVKGVVVQYPEGQLSYESTDLNIATAFGNTITAHELGETDIVVTFAGHGKYLPCNATVHVKVVGVSSTITADEYIEVDAGSQSQISASVSPKNGKLTFLSNDTSVVSINQNGIFNALKIGVANITISYAGEGKYLPATKNVIIKVNGLKSEIKVNDTISINPLDTLNLNAVITPAGGKLHYLSNDTGIVSVDENGKITVHKEGLAKITVRFDGNGIYLPIEANVTVNSTRIQPQFEFISNSYVQVNGSQATIPIGFTGKLDFELNCGDIRNNLTFTVNDTHVISIENGHITSHAGGKAELTASYGGNERYAPFSKKLYVTIIKKITEIRVNDNITLSVEDVKNLDVKLFVVGVENPITNLKYTIDNPDVISLVNGRITALKKGTAAIHITFEETLTGVNCNSQCNCHSKSNQDYTGY